MEKSGCRLESEFALTGTAFKEERNLRKHVLSALAVIVAGLIFDLSAIEWLFLFLSIFWSLPLKLSDSAIENVVDLASDYHSMRAKCQGYGSGSCSGRVWLCRCDRTDYFVPKIWDWIFKI